MISDIKNRATWISALSIVPQELLLKVTNKLSQFWTIRPISIPQSGLGLIKLNDSAFNDAFYLGEIPVASSWLEVTTNTGVQAEGAALLMSDKIELAEALALCDAILSAHLSGWEQVAALVQKGLLIQQDIQDERKRLLAHTEVNFSLLDEVNNVNT